MWKWPPKNPNKNRISKSVTINYSYAAAISRCWFLISPSTGHMQNYTQYTLQQKSIGFPSVLQ